MLNLIGYGTPFDSAESARQALLKLTEKHNQGSSAADESEQTKNQRLFKKLLIPIISLLLLFLGWGVWYVFFSNRNKSVAETYEAWKQLKPEFSDVDLPPGNFDYTAESNSTWNVVLKKDSGQLEDILTHPLTDKTTSFIYKSFTSANVRDISQPIKEVKAGNSLSSTTTLKLQTVTFPPASSAR